MKGIFVVSLVLCVIAVFVAQAEAAPQPFIDQFLSPFMGASQITQLVAFFTKIGELIASVVAKRITLEQAVEQALNQFRALTG